MVTGIFSIFHSPRVEPSFNVMGDIIEKKSQRINLETYSAIQDIKYGLKTRYPLKQNWSVKEFHWKGRPNTAVNPALTMNMRNSFSLYNAEQKTGKEKLFKRQ